MSELSYTKEPWSTEYRQSVCGYSQEIFDADGQVIATAAWYIVQVSPETITTNREQNARRIVACVNACAGLDTALLENITMLGDTLKDRIDVLRNEANQRDQLLAALEKYEAAFNSLFVQCCSNPIRNAWGEEVNLSLLNEAHHAAGTAIAAVKGGGAC